MKDAIKLQELKVVLCVIAAVFTIAANNALASEEPKPVAKTLITNVRIFNGENENLSENMCVLVEGNKIVSIAKSTVEPENAEVIDGEGRTLMPGLIDAHVHMMMSDIPLSKLMMADPNYVTLVAGKGATATLMRGFTSVRDLGGPSFGLKRAIDEGVLPGPRIWPAGATISQTSGHGDFRSPHHDVPAGPCRCLHFTELEGFTSVADGRPLVLQAVREQLMKGASQIKVMAGGGVASDNDPLDVSQYTEDELKAAVQATEAWNTYVTVHAYTPSAIQKSIRAGVRCIEHGQLADEATVRLIAESGVWWSMQPFLDDEDAIPFPEGSANRKKQLEMTAGTDNAYRLAKKHKVKLAWGTDTLFDPVLATKQGKQLAKMKRWFTPYEVLKMATHDNAQLLKLCGPRNPYPGELGVVKEGALADLILVDGNPLQNLDLVADPDKNFVIIMKNGVICKNTLR
ncbi:amidohydrolase family protein [bacterium]|nr:amidohydrolase family protein [bacterium]